MKNLFVTKSSEFSYDSYVLDVSVRPCVRAQAEACCLLLPAVAVQCAWRIHCMYRVSVCVCVSAGCNC